MSNGALPDYISMAKPNPPENRAPWYKNTAPTYAGIFLWFVFWSTMPGGGASDVAGGVLGQGLGVAFLGLSVAALLCHFLFYLVPGLFGMKTGLPLYVVGSSTYGTQGGFRLVRVARSNPPQPVADAMHVNVHADPRLAEPQRHHEVRRTQDDENGQQRGHGPRRGPPGTVAIGQREVQLVGHGNGLLEDSVSGAARAHGRNARGRGRSRCP